MSSVDVLLASYNGEKYISEQIESILAQTYKNFRIIIRDDGSNDNTVKIIHDYQKRYPEIITVISDNAKCGSPTSNFFEILKYADSNYIMFSDQDDFWFPEKISTTLSEMQKLESQYGNNTPILVFAASQATDETLKPLNPDSTPKKIPENLLRLNRLLVENCGVGGCVLMANRVLYKNIGSYSPEIMIHDWWFAIYASACGIIRYIPKNLMFYRQHGNNSFGSIKLRGLRYRLKRFSNLQDVKNTLHNYLKQAILFRERYSANIKNDSLKQLNEFINLHYEKSKIKRIFKLFKGQFLKQDWARILAQIIYV